MVDDTACKRVVGLLMILTSVGLAASLCTHVCARPRAGLVFDQPGRWRYVALHSLLLLQLECDIWLGCIVVVTLGCGSHAAARAVRTHSATTTFATRSLLVGDNCRLQFSSVVAAHVCVPATHDLIREDTHTTLSQALTSSCAACSR